MTDRVECSSYQTLGSSVTAPGSRGLASILAPSRSITGCVRWARVPMYQNRGSGDKAQLATNESSAYSLDKELHNGHGSAPGASVPGHRPTDCPARG